MSEEEAWAVRRPLCPRRVVTCCRVKQPEHRSTQCLIERNTIPSTDSSLSPICISTDCIA